MIIYFVLLASALLTLISNRMNIRFSSLFFGFISFFIMLFIIMFRSVSVGSDYIEYKVMFDQNINLLYRINVEKGYVFINAVAHFFNSFQFVSIFLCLLLVCGLYFLSVSFRLNTSDVIAAYVITYTFCSSLNIMRQFYAIGISMVGIAILFKYIDSNKLLASFLYLLIVIVAKQFHSSALFLLIFLILPYIKVNKKIVFITSIITTLFYFTGFLSRLIITLSISLNPVYQQKYGSNIGVLSNFDSKGIVYYLLMMSLFIVLYISLDYIKYDKNDKKINFILSGFLLYLVMFIGGYNVTFTRLQVYTNIFPILFIGLLFKKDRKDINLLLILLVGIWSFLYVYRIMVNNSGIVPFSLI